MVFSPEKPISRHVLWFLKGFSHGNTKGVSERNIWETHYVFPWEKLFGNHKTCLLMGFSGGNTTRRQQWIGVEITKWWKIIKWWKMMENGETVIGMLHHMIIRLWYWSRECTLSWVSDAEEEYTEVTEKYRRKHRMKWSVPNSLISIKIVYLWYISNLHSIQCLVLTEQHQSSTKYNL